MSINTVTPESFGYTPGAIVDPYFAQCKAALAASGGGIISFGPSTYLTQVGLLSDVASVRMLGASQGSTAISTNRLDVTAVTLAASQCSLEHFSILGKGSSFDPTTFGATQPAVLATAGAVGARVIECSLYGGSSCLDWACPEGYVERIRTGGAYGGGLVVVTGGGWFRQVSMDQQWPVMPKLTGSGWSAWAASHAYAKGDVVASGGYFLQCSIAGTSGSAAPTLANYNMPISDGSAQWLLMSPCSGAAMRIDTGASEVYIVQGDLTGCCNTGLLMTNTFGGAAPGFVRADQLICSQTVGSPVAVNAGSDLRLSMPEIGGSIGAGQVGINIGGSFGGSFELMGGEIRGMPYAVFLGAGAGHRLIGVDLSQSTQAAVLVGSGISRFNVIGCDLSGSPTGVEVVAGASDHYSVIGNTCAGCVVPVSDAGTGTHKTIFGNN